MDFGVLEMFEKVEDMWVVKLVGLLVFFFLELCGKYGEVLGKVVDIWGMGVMLYCLWYGKIFFYRDGLLEIFEVIKGDEFYFFEDENLDFVDLMKRFLEKDFDKWIKMDEFWVSCSILFVYVCRYW